MHQSNEDSCGGRRSVRPTINLRSRQRNCRLSRTYRNTADKGDSQPSAVGNDSKDNQDEGELDTEFIRVLTLSCGMLFGISRESRMRMEPKNFLTNELL